MKGYHWVKGYHYTKVPTFKVSFVLFKYRINLFHTGYKRMRVGCQISNDNVFKLYDNLLTKQL
jgi:hypothetical protein